MTLLRHAAPLNPVETSVVRFLTANDLAALGLEATAIEVFRDLVRHPRLGGAAFVGLARLRDERREHSTLKLEAERAPWEWMEPDDAVEAAYRVARACVATERFADARVWLSRVPPESPYAPYAHYVLAQAEYGLGNYGAAVEAARPIFDLPGSEPTISALRDRTAVLLGDMFIEIGLYGYAEDLLRWPAPSSPFYGRARRDLALSRALSAIAGGEIGTGNREIDRVDGELETAADGIGTKADTQQEAALLGANLAVAWPSRALLDARRRWAASRALEALDAARGASFGRLFQAAFESLPPVFLYRLATRPSPPPPPPSPTVGREAAFLFPPERELSRALVALAVAEERAGDRSCPDAAARALRSRVTVSLLGESKEPTLGEVSEIARGCGRGPVGEVAARARAHLLAEIPAETRRRQRRIREQRYRVDDAIARFRLSRSDEIQTLRTTK
ncbi:MAG: tetratricopeptide repeat protein [Candidatus Binatia bacterium]